MLRAVAKDVGLLSTKAVPQVEPQRRRREGKEETLRVDGAAWGRGREIGRDLSSPKLSLHRRYVICTSRKKHSVGRFPKLSKRALRSWAIFFELPVHRDSSSQPQLLFSIL